MRIRRTKPTPAPIDRDEAADIRHALAVVWEEGFDHATLARRHHFEGDALRDMNPYRKPLDAQDDTLQPIDRDELKAVIMSCGPDPAAAEVADAVVAWLGER